MSLPHIKPTTIKTPAATGNSGTRTMKPTTVKRIINEIINDGKGIVTITIEMNNGRVFVTDFDKEPGTCSTIAWDDEDPTIMRIETDEYGTKWIDATQVMSIEI